MACLRCAGLLFVLCLAIGSAQGMTIDTDTLNADPKNPLTLEQQITIATVAGTEHLKPGCACRIDTEVQPDGVVTIHGSYFGTVKRADKDGVTISVVFFREQRDRKKSLLDKLPYMEGLSRSSLVRGAPENKEMWIPTHVIRQIAWRGIESLNEARALAQQNPAIVATKLSEGQLRLIIDHSRLNSLALMEWHSVKVAPPGSLCRVESSKKFGPMTTFSVHEGTIKSADASGVLLLATRRKEWQDPARPILSQIPIVDFFYTPKAPDIPWQELTNQGVWIPAQEVHDVLMPRNKTVANSK